jgi:hypothetical protein
LQRRGWNRGTQQRRRVLRGNNSRSNGRESRDRRIISIIQKTVGKPNLPWVILLNTYRDTVAQVDIATVEWMPELQYRR